MKKEERDIIDDLFREKLHGFEAETTHDDWEAIASRLPEPKSIPLRRRWPYWAAAAVVSLFVICTGIYFTQNQPVDPTIAKQIEKETSRLESQIAEDKQDKTIAPSSVVEKEPELIAVNKQPQQHSTIQQTGTTLLSHAPEIKTIHIAELPTIIEAKTPDLAVETPTNISNIPVVTDISPIAQPVKATKTSSRKWSFGAGAGGLTQSAGNVVNTYALRSNTYINDDRLLALNAVSDVGKSPKTNIKHRTPISFGVSVSRHLNDRFSLQSGLSYAMVTSDWETMATVYNNKTRQRLHFLGIPLSVSYKIAEWNRFNFYASAGGQAEVNVAGKERVKSYFEDKQIGVDTKNVRMKEWQWSVNARVGVSYPIIRYISAFAEVGAAYYFDNGSKIETVYSDKSFNVNPQIGIRLGF